MNSSEDENVCSVKKENNLGYYRLHTIWRKDGCFLNITSHNGAWRGEMTQSDIADMSCKLETDPESYLKQCKKALTSHGGQPGMVYAVENGCFAWKKVEDEDSGIKIKMGSIRLEPTSFVDTIQNLVTAALNCNKNLQEKLKEVSDVKDKILENRNDLLSKLNELIKTKETMENDLYSRFILLINSKKKKIEELENLLEERYQSITPGKSDNPYEIDTDSDSEWKILKSKKDKKSEVIVRKHSTSSDETPGKKKLKNLEDTTNKDMEVPYVKSFSPEPSTSSEVEKKESKEMSLAKDVTKDELYDYFYGGF